MLDTPEFSLQIRTLVNRAVGEWLRWVAGWELGKVRHRISVCRRCTGSPLVLAAGFATDVPHQVQHALVMRIQKIVDTLLDAEIAAKLPLLHAELTGAKEWRQPTGFDPRQGLAPEYDGGELDPEPDSAQPFLFTLAELAEQPQNIDPVLPRPPLTVAEKQQLRAEIAQSDEFASRIGHAAAFELQEHREKIAQAIARYVEPQISALLQELSRSLDFPGFN